MRSRVQREKLFHFGFARNGSKTFKLNVSLKERQLLRLKHAISKSSFSPYPIQTNYRETMEIMWGNRTLYTNKCPINVPHWPSIKVVYVALLKELEHRKLGWKVLILKNYLGKSLSKEMRCKMADTKKILTTYFKRWKMHVIWGKSFLCPWTRKRFPFIMNGILEMSWFVHIFLQN